MAIEPVDVAPVRNVDELQRLLAQAVGRGNPVIKTPTRKNFPPRNATLLRNEVLFGIRENGSTVGHMAKRWFLCYLPISLDTIVAWVDGGANLRLTERAVVGGCDTGGHGKKMLRKGRCCRCPSLSRRLCERLQSELSMRRGSRPTHSARSFSPRSCSKSC
jgi:hypothetical protein